MDISNSGQKLEDQTKLVQIAYKKPLKSGHLSSADRKSVWIIPLKITPQREEKKTQIGNNWFFFQNVFILNILKLQISMDAILCSLCPMNNFLIAIKYIFSRNFWSISNSTINSFSFNTYSYAKIWKKKKFLEHYRIVEWNLSKSKKGYSFLTEGSLQNTIEGIINVFKGTTSHLNKQASILIFWSYIMFMLYWSSRVTSVLILNIAYFPTLSVRKCLHILIEQKKTKSLKTENFDQASEKWTPLNSGQFWPDRRCSLFRGLIVSSSLDLFGKKNMSP